MFKNIYLYFFSFGPFLGTRLDCWSWQKVRSFYIFHLHINANKKAPGEDKDVKKYIQAGIV